MSNEIEKFLGLEPVVPSNQEIMPVEEESSDNSDRDYEYARKNMIDIINRGAEALENLADLADQSQNARMYEVLSTTMKTLIDANKDLVELSKSKNKAKASSNVTNNNLFVGSTSDLQKLLKGSKDE